MIFKTSILLAALALPLALGAQEREWANHARYAEANARIATRPAAVFMGDSITDGWDNADQAFFDDNRFVCRGISGQVTEQMLCRFRADVLDLHPQVVVILAGTNDLARNNGPIAPEHIVDNIASMIDLALVHGIRPVLCSVPPAAKYSWRPDIGEVPAKIRDLNDRLRRYAAARGIEWVDYHSALDAGDGSLSAEHSGDGVHPTPAGYAVMEGILLPVVQRLLRGDEAR